ncbi:MAG TPA: 3,4-dihydroxy-2-butanone-4-phosphate synthase [Actinophytocola sp.]|uniref:3,4-dihydroxy-2-butanone-4-phosphate synthase n=1 Tax=Actinophytocola sp. TaxID=1872138 RepID=UPI002DBD95B1|nr:3,4-dihydroxy-2-butanone-4-phosphate synthase [Actinophytocola sp.]HEU5472493.1 3,4-dihydroxy-2-butanone-4-phosphate synthase [Actinophytocola sp.]
MVNAAPRRPGHERTLDSIDAAVTEFAAGRPIIVVDDEDRENEGDLVIAACHATPAVVGLMIRYGSGVICAPMVAADLDRLRIPPMTITNEDPKATAYTVSVDAHDGCTTGISAADRARTLRVLADPTSTRFDLHRPGHVFPLRAVPGGVLSRPGHTEAAVDFARLAGLPPVGAICELAHDDGSMMRLPGLIRLARRRNLVIVSIADLIKHRLRHESHLAHTGNVRLPTRHGTFGAIAYWSTIDSDRTEVLALVIGDVAGGEEILVYPHQECVTGDLLAATSCTCREFLDAALSRIARSGRGVVLYLRRPPERPRPPRTVYHPSPACADRRDDTPARIYSCIQHILNDLNIRSIRLLNIGTTTFERLQDFGTAITATEPLDSPTINADHEPTPPCGVELPVPS